jgi:hypothetical protein
VAFAQKAAMIANALTARPVDISPWVFGNRRGEGYYHEGKADPASGWKSIWRRAVVVKPAK